MQKHFITGLLKKICDNKTAVIDNLDLVINYLVLGFQFCQNLQRLTTVATVDTSLDVAQEQH